jgi:hypothetical protein
MRARSIQQAMWRLAMLAALLLACMPTIGRMIAAAHATPDASGAMPGMQSMSSMPASSMSMLPMPMPSANNHTPSGTPVPACPDRDDCAYCSLLNTVAGLTVLLILLLPQRALGVLPTRRSLPRIAVFHPCGLGSRGPPLAA